MGGAKVPAPPISYGFVQRSDDDSMIPDLSTAPVLAGPATPYAFGGVAIGASFQTFRSAYPQARCLAARRDKECAVHDQPVGGGYFARDLTYRFQGDRLVGIAFHSSIDGFAFVVAKLKHDFGPPAAIRRDDVTLRGHVFDHVAFTWRNGRSTILMSDPSTPDQLKVRFGLDSAASPEGSTRRRGPPHSIEG